MKRLWMAVTGLMMLVPSVAFAAEPAAPPPSCAEDQKFREQDFTIGTWNVYSNGKLSAQVRMERSLNGCAIHEVWTTEGGRPGSGLGLFTYSRLSGKWQYLWAADTGASTSFEGSLIGAGEMRYVTVKPLPGGKSRLRHWSLIAQPDGGVRELSVGTEDDGKTWTTEYDLMWVRVNN